MFQYAKELGIVVVFFLFFLRHPHVLTLGCISCWTTRSRFMSEWVLSSADFSIHLGCLLTMLPRHSSGR